MPCGARFGPDHRYELGLPIGVGGSAVVHRVVDHRSGGEFAGKFAFASPNGFGEFSLLREGEILARLQHESIVSLIDRGTACGSPYLIMEYARGDTLATCIAAAKLTALKATRVVIDLVEGLAHAHRRGILHLDIKPSNVVLLETGHVKIIDFGAGSMPVAARTLMQEPHSSESELSALQELDVAASFVKGTLHYMAPEQWTQEPSHPRMDLWAAGMLYYELLTGCLPFGTQPACLRLRMAHLERVTFSAATLGLPTAIDHVIANTLALDPHDRFSSAAALLLPLMEIEALLARASTP